MSKQKCGVTICNIPDNLLKGRGMTTKDVLTVEEVAEYLRIHPYTARRLARAGKIPGFKVGGQWRFEAKEIEAWKKEQGKDK